AAEVQEMLAVDPEVDEPQPGVRGISGFRIHVSDPSPTLQKVPRRRSDDPPAELAPCTEARTGRAHRGKPSQVTCLRASGPWAHEPVSSTRDTPAQRARGQTAVRPASIVNTLPVTDRASSLMRCTASAATSFAA